MIYIKKKTSIAPGKGITTFPRIGGIIIGTYIVSVGMSVSHTLSDGKLKNSLPPKLYYLAGRASSLLSLGVHISP